MKITEDFIGNETKALTKTKISTILRWWGFNPDSYSTWGNARVDMNNILSGSSSSTISNREPASSFLSKINYINDTDTVISDISFASNEAGVWFDPSDFSTLFQDSAGTMPVTAVEQPVGLMLDKSRGKHANGPRRVNLLTNTVFAGAVSGTNSTGVQPTGWSKVFWTGGSIDVDNSADDRAITFSTTSGRMVIGSQLSVTEGQVYVCSADIEVLSDSYTPSSVIDFTSAGTGHVRQYFFNGVLFDSGSITSSGRLVCVLTIGSGVSTTTFRLGSGANATRTGVIKISRPDVRSSADSSILPSYQRITVSWSAAIPGNHTSQPTPTARPILSARYNLLASTEDCSRVWVLTNNVIGSNVTCPDGRPGILITKSNTIINAHARQGLGNSIVDATYSYQVAIYAGSTNLVSVGIGATNDGSGVWGDTNTSVTKISGPGSVSSASGLGIVTGLSSTVPTVVRVERKYISSVAASVCVYPGTHNSKTEGHSVIVQDVDCRFAFDRINLPSYQRVGDLTTDPADYDTTGFAPYLRFDGVDDSLSTAPFSANSSICQVCVSLKKLTDASRGVVLEYGNNSNNSLLIDTGVSTDSHTPGPFIRLTSRGTASFSAGMVDVGGLPAPAMALLYGEASTTSNITRVFLNGSLSGEASGNQGGSDYAQSSLFIGSRDNSLLRFSGRLYQMILRFGATSGNIKNVFETQTRNARRSY